MNDNEGPPTGRGTEDDYEATVLDFLNQEMASIQKAQKPTQQSEELDALVTDLLQQVITEADKPLFDEDELFVGLTPELRTPADAPEDPLLHSEPSSPVDSDEAALPEAESAVENPEPASAAATIRREETAIFGSSTVATSRKFPVKIAAALAGLGLCIGAAAYFFSGRSGKSLEPQAPVAQIAKSDTAATPVSRPPAPTTAATHEKPAAIVKPKMEPAPRPGPVAPEKSHAQPAPPQPPQMPSPSVVTQKPEPEPAPAKVVNEQKILAPEPVPVSQVSMQAAPVTEKPSLQPATATSAPVIPERKPAPAPPVASAAKEPPSPSPTPPPVAPPVSSNLIPAVPISQVSPVFPALALRARASGQVVMELQIDSHGKVIKAKAVSGPAIFYNAAVAAVMKWRYKPASVSGVNVPSQSRVTMSFNLKE
jgi:protein TonB